MARLRLVRKEVRARSRKRAIGSVSFAVIVGRAKGVDILAEVGGVKSIDEAREIFNEKLDPENLGKLEKIENEEVIAEVAELAEYGAMLEIEARSTVDDATREMLLLRASTVWERYVGEPLRAGHQALIDAPHVPGEGGEEIADLAIDQREREQQVGITG